MAKNAHCPPAQAPLLERCEGAPADWLLPDWPAPSHVHALFTSRSGGVSQSEYASMNLGDHVGDERQAVALNRARLAAALHRITPGTRPVFLNQVHGSHCEPLSNATPDGTPCDAVFATAPGPACTIMVADCLPVLITDLSGSKVAAAHAGWRGLAGGVLEAAVERFWAPAQSLEASTAINPVANDRSAASDFAPENALNTEPHQVAGTGPENAHPELIAWLGPCIGPSAFEVGQEVADAFCALDSGAEVLFKAQGQGKYRADLPGLARRRLAALGVSQVYGNDGSDAWCTVLQDSRFFSHRRDGVSIRTGSGLHVSGTGRMAACIWLA